MSLLGKGTRKFGYNFARVPENWFGKEMEVDVKVLKASLRGIQKTCTYMSMDLQAIELAY